MTKQKERKENDNLPISLAILLIVSTGILIGLIIGRIAWNNSGYEKGFQEGYKSETASKYLDIQAPKSSVILSDMNGHGILQADDNFTKIYIKNDYCHLINCPVGNNWKSFDCYSCEVQK